MVQNCLLQVSLVTANITTFIGQSFPLPPYDHTPLAVLPLPRWNENPVWNPLICIALCSNLCSSSMCWDLMAAELTNTRPLTQPRKSLAPEGFGGDTFSNNIIYNCPQLPGLLCAYFYTYIAGWFLTKKINGIAQGLARSLLNMWLSPLHCISSSSCIVGPH